MAPNWTNLVRFISEEDGQIHLGEVDSTQYLDVGVAIFNGEKVAARLVRGSIFDGIVTDTIMHIARVIPHLLNLPSPSLNLTYRSSLELASRAYWDRRRANNPMYGAELPRPCQRGEHAHPRCARTLLEAPYRAQRTLPRENQCAEDCTGWIE